MELNHNLYFSYTHPDLKAGPTSGTGTKTLWQ
jgi:hypothetical protein